MRKFAAIFVAVAFLTMTGCQTGGSSYEAPAPDLDGLRAAADLWDVGFNGGDPVATAAVYAPDAKVFPPNMPPMEGRAAIEELWRGFIEAGLTGDLEIEDLEASGDVGYRVGRFVLHESDGSVLDEGHFVEVWKKIDGN